MSVQITEATRVLEATPVDGQPGRLLIGLITPGQGSSGFYSADVLEAAANDKIFAAGTHMYLDHPTESDKFERPERSVKDLAAVLAEDALWDGTQLVAEATVFGPYRDAIAEMKDAIGLSIRGSAEMEEGEVDGRHTRIVTRLVEASSVDFVTHAGRGGRILEVLESARKTELEEARNIGQWIESRIHRDFTITADDMAGEGRLTREERIILSGAIGDALAAFVNRLEADAPALYQRDLWDDPTDTVAAAIEAATTIVPVDPAGQQKTEESKEDTMATTTIEESRLRELEEAAGRVTALEAERDTEKAGRVAAEALVAEAKINTRMGEIIAEADTDFTDLEIVGLKAMAPVNEGVLDEAEFKTAVDKAAATIAEAGGAGSVRGNGRTTPPSQGISESEFAQRLGLTTTGA